jgi:hypothetical protein
MDGIQKVLLFSIIAIGLSSCGTPTSVFKQDMREQYKLNEQDLKSIQFYVSGPIVLTRYSQGATKTTEGGELTLMKDEVVERIVIKAGTPCLIKDVVDGNRVTVTFEDGDNRFLVFGSIKRKGGDYYLQALDWGGERGGKLSYGEKEYIVNSNAQGVFLFLKVKSLNRFKLDEKVVKGKTLN